MSTDEELQSLVKRAGEIVKDLPVAIQGEAFNRVFETLSREAGLEATPQGKPRVPAAQIKKKTEAKQTRAKGTRTKKVAKTTRPTLLKDLNLRPKGKPSLSEFVTEKEPKSDHERKLVAVYYITRVLEMEATVDHVYSCFKDQGWKVPADLLVGLRLTANKKAWLDTSDSSSITVAIPGENHIEYDMPGPAKNESK